MKKILLCLLLFNTTYNLFAQKKITTIITGSVIDSVTGKPIDYATISLFFHNNDKAVNGTTTDSTGAFELQNVEAGNYKIIIEFIGYKPYTIKSLDITQQSKTVSIKTVRLIKITTQLQDVVVTAQRPLIENKIDKLVFNAEKDITSQTGVATDVLKKVPQVSVDADGNVELAGSTSIRFLINGKPSTVFGSNIVDVLQSIPASQIKSIEVITNPGAKYDAQGLGGIINIILKQNTAQGINGNVSLTAGTRTENGSFNLNMHKGNFGMNAFVSGNYNLRVNALSSYNRVSLDTTTQTKELLEQNGNREFKRHGAESGIGFDWTIKKKNNFTGSFEYDSYGNSGFGTINQNQILSDSNDHTLSVISSVNKANNKFYSHYIEGNINYKRTFNKEDQELDISVDQSHNITSINANNYQSLLPMDSLFYGTFNNNPGKENETEITVDYTQPFKNDIVLGVGGKINLYNINSVSDVLSFQPDEKLYLFDTSLSNYLNYRQKVYAVYSELSFPAGKLFDAKIGGRYERIDLNSFYSNAHQQVNSPGYNTFVPSVFFSKKLNGRQTLKLSYSKRIERPEYWVLNPFINTSDPKNISSGNPYLKPEIGHRIEFSYNKDWNFGSLIITAFYRLNKNDIQPYIIFYPTLTVGDSTYTNVAVNTRQNIGTEKNTGLSLFFNFNLNSKLNIRTNIFSFYRYTINAIDAGYNSHSFNYRLNMNADYQFTKTLAAEFFGNFNSARHEAQGKYPSFTSYSFAIRKQFWNKNGSLALTANNFFKEYINQTTYLFGPGFNSTALRKIPVRSVGINFTWKFGKFEFKKDDQGNDDTKANEGGNER
jgi:ferric enterobactin receptor